MTANNADLTRRPPLHGIALEAAIPPRPGVVTLLLTPGAWWDGPALAYNSGAVIVDVDPASGQFIAAWQREQLVDALEIDRR